MAQLLEAPGVTGSNIRITRCDYRGEPLGERINNEVGLTCVGEGLRVVWWQMEYTLGEIAGRATQLGEFRFFFEATTRLDWTHTIDCTDITYRPGLYVAPVKAAVLSARVHRCSWALV